MYRCKRATTEYLASGIGSRCGKIKLPLMRAGSTAGIQKLVDPCIFPRPAQQRNDTITRVGTYGQLTSAQGDMRCT